MQTATDILTAREWAIAVVAAAFIVFAIVNRDVRKQILIVLRVACAPRILGSVIAMAVWSAGLVYLANLVGLWNTDLLKDTIFWFFGVAILLLMRMERLGRENRQIRRTLFQVAGASAILATMIGETSYPFAVELVLVVIGVVVAPMLVLAKRNPAHAILVKPLEFILSGIAFLYVAQAIHVAFGWNGDEWKLCALSILLPIWLTAGLLPLVLSVSIYAAYEQLFVRARHARGERIPLRIRAAIIVGVGLRPSRIWRVPGLIQRDLGRSTGIKDAFKRARTGRTEAQSVPAASIPYVADLSDADEDYEEGIEFTPVQFFVLTGNDAMTMGKAIKAAQDGEPAGAADALGRLSEHVRLRQRRYLAAGGVHSDAAAALHEAIGVAITAIAQDNARALEMIAALESTIHGGLHEELEDADPACGGTMSKQQPELLHGMPRVEWTRLSSRSR